MSIYPLAPLGEVLYRIIGGGTPSKSLPQYWSGSIPWCSVKDMKEGCHTLSETQDSITEEGLKNSASNLIPAGTVITSTRMGLGRAFINQVDMSINQDLKALIPNRNIHNIFLLWSIIFQKDVIEGLGTGATVKGIRLETLKSIKIPLPPLPTQQKIVAILSAYDDLIENNLKRIKLLEEMAQITYEEWFVRLRFPDHESIAINHDTGLPEGWIKKQIQEIGDVITGKTPSTTNSDFFGNDVPFIKTPDMADAPYVIRTEQSLSRVGADSQKKKYLPKNSLMVSCIGTVGVTGLVAIPSQTNQQINSIVFKIPTYIYFMYCLSRRFKPLLDGLGSNGATMTNVNKGKFEAIGFDCPNLELLEKFHASVSSNFDAVLNLQFQNQRLREARDILLPRLMTGVIDVESYDPAQLLKEVV